MQFGLYAPLPHVCAGAPKIVASVSGALEPLPDLTIDPAFDLSRDICLAADKAGFDIILFAERHLGADIEAWIHAAAVTAQTDRITAMVAVHPGLWHPVMVAKMAASLDRICKGRMAVNLVTGWNVEEHRMFGGDTLHGTEERYLRAEEFVDVLRGVWSSLPYSKNGAIFEIEGVELRLRPASRQTPEIFTASRSSRGLDMVAKVGDWWFVDFDRDASCLEEVEESIRLSIADVCTRAEKLGRKVRFALNPYVAFGQSREVAMEQSLSVANSRPDRYIRTLQHSVGPMKTGCIGSPDQVRSQLRNYEALGIELFLLKFPPTLEAVEEIREEIIAPLGRRF